MEPLGGKEWTARPQNGFGGPTRVNVLYVCYRHIADIDLVSRMASQAVSVNLGEKVADGNLCLAIFAHQPQQWGLRGDPYLWTLLTARLVGTPDAAGSEAAVQAIYQTFLEITGHHLALVGDFRLNGIPKTGMSGGMISGETWRIG